MCEDNWRGSSPVAVFSDKWRDRRPGLQEGDLENMLGPGRWGLGENVRNLPHGDGSTCGAPGSDGLWALSISVGARGPAPVLGGWLDFLDRRLITPIL